MAMTEPLIMRPFFADKPWGGTRLRDIFGKDIPTDTCGESWELSARPGFESVVISGRVGGVPLEGLTLTEAIGRCGAALTGAKAGGGEFPLLIKLLDARQNLSVQVHPDDDYARRIEGEPYGKTEAWAVLEADPDARLVMGLNNATTADIRRALSEGALEGLLRWEDVSAGDVFHIPAGTVHALCAGVMVYEVQQSSDRTYRLYDWGRARPLDVEKSLDVLRAARGAGRVPALKAAGGITPLVRDAYFLLDRYGAGARYVADGSTFFAITALRPTGIAHKGGVMRLRPGETALAPALLGAFELSGEGFAAYLP